MSLNFDNVMYQIMALFQRGPGFLRWEQVSQNSDRYITY